MCDWPDCAREGEEWFMTPPGRPRTAIDLCEEHSAALREVFAHAPRPGEAQQVKTIEQVEREKEAARRAASRRARGQGSS
jgi:hypothetical protein